MLNPRQKFLLLALVGLLMGALSSVGCAHKPSVGTVPAKAVSTGPESAEQQALRLVKKTPPLRPANDRRYQLPPARNREFTVFLGSQTFEYVEDGQVILSGPVSSGTVKNPTPIGEFRVLSKEIDKRSGTYRNDYNQPTPMPFSLRFYAGYFIHEAWVSDTPSSRGCIYLRHEDARLLFDRIQLGDRIVIKREGAARVANAFLANPQTPSRRAPGFWSRLFNPSRS
ncbi:L,D-transpeptidase [uncultured Thiodictyon sp.]|uniref:L,D-transpeptidase n=1 Tax=uncultured Thiodictyon sp. TaxID=1846217 RepID=UPI0025FA5125|nr:L,D-transpeptidase [uncultured Thiodictyon sp.]